MRSQLRWALITALCAACVSAHAQIYTCTAEDGTRVFSDEKCGPDARVVPGITSKKRAAPNTGPKKTTAPKSEAELDALIRQCNAGDMRACTQWTHGGGPALLREQERKSGLACEGGSLPDCERRYCADGITDECRARVFQAAKVSGDAWYLREQRALKDGAVAYQVRCAKPGVEAIHDITVTCSGPPGPNRCSVSDAAQGFARLDQAAVNYCSI
jgi:hypothetical protein